MSLTPTEGLKLSARDRPEPGKTKDQEAKRKLWKEGLASKHRRIVSTDFNPSNLTGNSSNITPETGSNQMTKASPGTGTTGKKDETGKLNKFEHRRVQSNIVEQMGNLPLGYGSFSKSKEAQELVKKYTSKLLRYKDITFKRQKKPTEVATLEKTPGATKKGASSAKGGNKSSASKASPSKHSTPLFTVASANNSPIMQSGSQQSGYKKTKASAGGKKFGNLIKPIKADPTIGIFSNPIEQIFSKTSISSKHNRVKSGDFNSSLKGIKRDARGVSAERNQSWGNNIKAKKLLMMAADKQLTGKKFKSVRKEATEGSKTQKGIKNSLKQGSGVSSKGRAITDGLRSEPISNKDSGINIQRIAPPQDNSQIEVPKKPKVNPELLKKVHHKKNPSLPAPNLTSKLVENLNIPICMNFKGPTMTPDESRRNSPRELTPRGPAPTDRKVETQRQGSFIVEDDVEENQQEYYFSHLLYSRQKQTEKDKTEEKTKEVFLDFCTDQDEIKPKNPNPTGANNSMMTDQSLIADQNTPKGPFQSRGGNPPVSKFALDSQMHQKGGFSKESSHSKLKEKEGVKMYSQQNSHRLMRSEDEGTLAKHLMPSLGSAPHVAEEGFRNKNQVPLVLQKLMLMNKIKEYYGKDCKERKDSRGKEKDILTTLDFYQLVKRIGEGSFGKVYQAVSVLTGKEVAIKKFDKAEIKTDLAKQKIFQEAKILTMLDHPNVARMLEVFENKGNIFCVMEFAKEGDILELIKARGPLTEDIARFIVIQVAHGLKHCHSRNILHRDIKLDNVLLSANFISKICDFGISKIVRKGETMHEDCGTPAYTAPEVVSGKGYVGFKADVWSLGIMLFVMVTGRVPFKDKDKSKSLEVLHELIKKGDFSYPTNVVLSDSLKDLINKMLIVNVDQRITIDEVIAHPWFQNPMITELTAFIKSNESNANNDYALRRVLELGFPESAVRETVEKQKLNHIHCCYQIYRHN